MSRPILRSKIWRRFPVRHLLMDVLLILASAYASLYVRVGQHAFMDFLPALNRHLPILIGSRLAIFVIMGVYTIMWRYMSSVDAVRITRASVAATGVILTLSFLFNTDLGNLPRSFYFIDALLVTTSMLGVRLLRRLWFEEQASKRSNSGTRTLIVGVGNNGRTLSSRFRTDSGLGVEMVGFVDDDPAKVGLVVAGNRVLGTTEELADLIEQNKVTQVIVAITHPSSELLTRILNGTRPFNIRPRIISSLAGLGDGPMEIHREIELSDLLNRPPREIDLTSLHNFVKGKRVLVTGAGGSIGSELARQLLRLEPNRLFLLDHSEFNLYEIDHELRPSAHHTDHVVPLMIDLKDHKSLSQAFDEYRPDLVFHAAAYKHVHLVENNPFPSILNNIQGTMNLLEECRRFDVSTFVLISSDKAVNPVGVMGATKRVCELLTTCFALQTGRRYCSVRFGNVLGSSGSFIPLLQNQIREGGPITITHPDITRFFMLIPEAVSLVLQAAVIAKPGDINVLKMGEPVRILDVARSMLALMGKSEDEVPIVYTGLRPGEKMFEELYIRGDELSTEHPDILTIPNGDWSFAKRTDLTARTTSPARLSNLLTQAELLIQRAEHWDSTALTLLNALIDNQTVANQGAANQTVGPADATLKSSTNPSSLGKVSAVDPREFH